MTRMKRSNKCWISAETTNQGSQISPTNIAIFGPE